MMKRSMKYYSKMGIDGVIEPIYFLITSFGFAILSFINYRKFGKTLETIYLSILILVAVCTSVVSKVPSDLTIFLSYIFKEY